MAHLSTTPSDSEQKPLLNFENTLAYIQEQAQPMNAAPSQDHSRPSTSFPSTNELIKGLRELQQTNILSAPMHPPGLPVPNAAAGSSRASLGAIGGRRLWYGIGASDLQNQNAGQEDHDGDDDVEWGPNLLQSIFETAQGIRSFCLPAKRTSSLSLERSNNKKQAPPTPPLSPTPTLESASISKASSIQPPSIPGLLLTPLRRKALPTSPKRAPTLDLPISHPNLEESRYSSLQHWKQMIKFYSGNWLTHHNKKLFSQDGHFKHPSLIPDRYRLKYTTSIHFQRRHRDLSPTDYQRRAWAKAKMADFRIWKAARLDVTKLGSEWALSRVYEPSGLSQIEHVGEESEMEWKEDWDVSDPEDSQMMDLWFDDLDLLG